MSFVKCASCGHRNSHSAAACANCDAPLTTWPEEESSLSFTPVQSYQRDDVRRDDVRRDDIRRDDIRRDDVRRDDVRRDDVRRDDVRRDDVRRDNVNVPSIIHKDVPVPRTARAVVTSALTEDELPYSTKMSDNALDIYTAAEFASGPSAEKLQPTLSESEPWKTEKLPLSLSWRKPALSGTIIHIEARDQSSHHHDGLLSTIFALFSEIIWIVPNSRTSLGQNDTDRVTITRIRIRTNEREIKDAQLRGDQKGANLALGDVISLWGRKHRGVLSIKKGYDHTSKSSIGADTKKEMMLPSLFLVALILLIFYFYPTIMHLVTQMGGGKIDIFALIQNLSNFLEHK